ncbi:hypothetical protein ACP70R_006749 [Stipagrostis hirtigluma subsp. patula]
METTAAKDAGGSPLDPRLAPLLLFDYDGKTPDGIDHASDGDGDGDGAGFLFYIIPANQLLIARVDAMRDHRYWATPQGWLLMAARGSPETFLWDPFTGGRIGLPPDREGFLNGDGHRRCLLSRKPVSGDPDCVVLVADLADMAFRHCRLGDLRWLKHEYECPALGAARGAALSAMSNLTAVGGRLFTKVCDKIATLEFTPGPVFAVSPVSEDRAVSPPSSCFWNRLVESRGDLFCVRFRWPQARTRPLAAIAGVGVFKLDLPSMVWVKAGSLDGRVFLFNRNQFGAAIDPREAGLKGDCVYYCVADDKALHVYDMERGSTALHDPGAFLSDRCSPKMVLLPTC